MSEQTRTTIRQRLYTLVIAGLGGMIASAISIAIAIYSAAHPPQAPVMQVGQQIDTGRWLMTIRSAHAGNLPPTGVAAFQSKQLVMVKLDVTNRSATPSNGLSSVVKLTAPVANLPMPTVYLDRDKSLAGYLNPDMPERVTMAWQWPQNVPPPERLTLAINSQVYKLRDNLYGASGWFDRGSAAIIQIPVMKTP